jgi:hypothetical protein
MRMTALVRQLKVAWHEWLLLSCRTSQHANAQSKQHARGAALLTRALHEWLLLACRTSQHADAILARGEGWGSGACVVVCWLPGRELSELCNLTAPTLRIMAPQTNRYYKHMPESGNTRRIKERWGSTACP